MTSKTIIVTGGTGAIGLSIARKFFETGCRVVILDLFQEKIDALTAEINNGNFTGFACDVTNENEIQMIFEKVFERHKSIDVLINNAGLQHVAYVEEFPTEKFRMMLEVMLTAPFMAIKQALPYMKEKGFGRIINMASVNGLIGFAGKSAYNSAKHGLIGLTKVVALETAPYNITVNAICPGYVDTPLVRNQLQDIAQTRNLPLEKVLEEVIFPLVPQKRLLDPAEIANYVYFLSDDLARGITGQALVIDGGYTAQ